METEHLIEKEKIEESAESRSPWGSSVQATSVDYPTSDPIPKENESIFFKQGQSSEAVKNEEQEQIQASTDSADPPSIQSDEAPGSSIEPDATVEQIPTQFSQQQEIFKAQSVKSARGKKLSDKTKTKQKEGQQAFSIESQSEENSEQAVDATG